MCFETSRNFDAPAEEAEAPGREYILPEEHPLGHPAQHAQHGSGAPQPGG